MVVSLRKCKPVAWHMIDANCLQLKSVKSASACPCPECRLLYHCMLRVLKASGEEALAVAFTSFAVGEQPVRAPAIKRHLERLIGQPRFKQRLVRSDGQMLADDVVLQGPMDLQLILRPFEASSQDQIWQLRLAGCHNNIPALEQLLQRPQDPDLKDADAWVALHFACSHGCVEAVLEANADKDKATSKGNSAVPSFGMWLRGSYSHVAGGQC